MSFLEAAMYVDEELIHGVYADQTDAWILEVERDEDGGRDCCGEECSV